MKKNLKKILILLILFVLAVAGYFTWSWMQLREDGAVYTSIEDANLPVAYVNILGRRMNELDGFVEDSQKAAGRGDLTLLPADRKLSVTIDKLDSQITGMQYEIRSLDGERLVERTTLDHWEQSGEEVSAELPIQNLLTEESEYRLTIAIATEKHPAIYFYTRVMWQQESRVQEMVDLAVSFSEKTFDYDSARELTTYLETDPNADNSSLGHVTLKSDFSQLTWKGLSMERVSEPEIHLRELQGIIGTIDLKYVVSEMKDGKAAAYYDVIFKNGNVVDVKNEQILQADIAVKDGKIAGIGHFSGENVIDCTGKYITPGFIDAHVHIESSMATPMEFSKAVMPHGTTTVIADPHELVNVKGNEAMEYILDAAGDAPLGIYVMMPSSIPATSFETNGADFTAEDMKQWKEHPLVLGLGEVMCYPAVLSKEEQIMKKLELCKGMVIDGHAPGLSGEDLKAYVEAGVMTDHECTSFEEAKEKCLAGMKILVREGSAARNVENIVPGLVKEPEFIAHFMFCTDDKHLDTIENEGHISYNIKKSIQLGMNPISAVKMATYNAAKTYGLNDIGVLEEGKDADIVILDSLESVEVHSVYKQGRIVNTEFFTKEAKPVNESMLHTVVLKNISKDKIQVKAEGKIPVIGMIPGQIVTKFLQEEVPSKDGLFTPDSEYSKLCVFERHRGTGNAAAAPIKGYGITNGAIATSVAHDSHNIIAAGDNDEDIIKAVQTIEEIQGGYALVSEGRVLGTLPLTVAGLLSQKPAKDIQKGIDELLQKAWKLGISRDIDPFITLSFMALPVIPSLRLTDLGLVDVDTFQLLKS